MQILNALHTQGKSHFNQTRLEVQIVLSYLGNNTLVHVTLRTLEGAIPAFVHCKTRPCFVALLKGCLPSVYILLGAL